MKRFFTFLTAILCSATMTFADDDTRTVISEAVFTGTIPTLEAGDSWTWAKRNTVGTALVAQNPVYYIYDGNSSSFALQKKDADDNFTSLSYYGDVITGGTYRFRTQLRIDGDNGSLYRLANDGTLTLTVAGQAWNVGSVSVYSTYSMVWVTSPEFEIAKKVLPLAFNFKDELNYGAQIINQAVAEKDLKNYTIGGSEEYTYTKVTNNVPWLKVSTAGIISGTPTEISQTAVKEKIRVSDGVNEPIEFEITAGIVAPAQNEREVISTAAFTGWVNPAVNDVLTSSYKNSFQAGITPADGAKYNLPEASNMSFYKKSGEEYVKMNTDDVFTEGDYKWSTQIRIDGDNGWFYILDEAANLTVTMNGKACPVSAGGQGNGYSYRYITYEFKLGGATALNTTAVDTTAVKRIVNGQFLIERDGCIFNAQGARVR